MENQSKSTESHKYYRVVQPRKFVPSGHRGLVVVQHAAVDDHRLLLLVLRPVGREHLARRTMRYTRTSIIHKPSIVDPLQGLWTILSFLYSVANMYVVDTYIPSTHVYGPLISSIWEIAAGLPFAHALPAGAVLPAHSVALEEHGALETQLDASTPRSFTKSYAATCDFVI